MKIIALFLSLFLLVSCTKEEAPSPLPQIQESNTVDIGNQPVFEVTESNIQPIR